MPRATQEGDSELSFVSAPPPALEADSSENEGSFSLLQNTKLNFSVSLNMFYVA